MVDNGTFLKIDVFEFSHHHPEDDVGLTNRIDARRDRAVVGDLVGRCVDLRMGRKGDREGVVGVAVFLPALRSGGSAGDERGQDECDRAHLGFLPVKMVQMIFGCMPD